MTIPFQGDKIAPVADDGGNLLESQLAGDAEAERPGAGGQPSGDGGRKTRSKADEKKFLTKAKRCDNLYGLSLEKNDRNLDN